MREVVIVGGARTAIANYMGSLQNVPANNLGVIALSGAMERYKIDLAWIEEVVGGHCGQASCQGSNTARWVTLKAGCRPEAVSMTVNQQCPSSLRAAEIIAQEIMLSKIDVGAAVGYENMSSMPYLLFGARSGYKLFQEVPIKDGLLYGGLLDPFLNYHMGKTAENIAQLYHISRQEQDEYALVSHQRAGHAIEKGWFKEEILPAEVTIKHKKVVFDTDEHPRPDSTLERVSGLPTVFDAEGTVTAFNASGMNDAGSALVMMSREKAAELGLRPLARVVSTASGARLIVTMLGEMKRRGGRYGCAALCASGGPGAAMIIENLQD